MMAPRTFFILFSGLVCMALATGVVVFPAGLIMAGAVLALLAVAAVADVLLGMGLLEDLAIETQAVLYLSKDRTAEMKIHIQNEQKRRRALRIGLAFPEEIDSPMSELIVPIPAARTRQTFAWPITARQRGIYKLRTCYLEMKSPLCLWSLRASRTIPLEIHVYPSLQKERRQLAPLFLRRGLGVHLQRRIGKGREFEQLREYLPGDSFDDIHWKATAKRGKPISKIYQVERTQELYLIMDASRLSGRSSSFGKDGKDQKNGKSEEKTESLIERFVTAALVLSLAARQQGDLFGLLTFDKQVQAFIKAQSGSRHYDACRKLLYTLQARPFTPDFDELFSFIRNRLRRRALLIFLTHLDDPLLSETFIKHIDLIARHHLVLVNMLRPDSVRPLFSNPDVHSLDDLYQELGGHLLWSNLRETSKILQRHGVHLHLLENENLCVELVSQYLSVKQRQLL